MDYFQLLGPWISCESLSGYWNIGSLVVASNNLQLVTDEALLFSCYQYCGTDWSANQHWKLLRRGFPLELPRHSSLQVPCPVAKGLDLQNVCFGNYASHTERSGCCSTNLLEVNLADKAQKPANCLPKATAKFRPPGYRSGPDY